MRRAALAALVVLLTVAPAARADVRGAVAGVRDPAAGIVELTVLASEGDSVGLRSAAATARRRAARRRAVRRPCVPSRRDRPRPAAPRPAPWRCSSTPREVADGLRRLEVAVEDGAGRVTRLVDRPILVANAPLLVAVDGHADAGLGHAAAGRGRRPAAPAPTVPGGRAGVRAAAPVDAARPAAAAVPARDPGARARAPLPLRGPADLPRRRAPPARSARAPASRSASVVRGRTVAKPAISVRRDGRLSAWIRAGGPADRRVPHPRGGWEHRARAHPDPRREGPRVRRAAAVLAAAVAAAAAAAPAAAQDPGTEVGGTVPSYLALGLSDPEGFATFPAGAGAYELTVRARVTSTDGRVTLERGGRRRRLRRPPRPARGRGSRPRRAARGARRRRAVPAARRGARPGARRVPRAGRQRASRRSGCGSGSVRASGRAGRTPRRC